ncbi:hypothetical protein CDD82_7149 [Ophiocordyceps australis]|uniref:Uncharacterized protein n=1 Tax=Ophiocordyceps australis TaxID=1399860 RepID=A0A2C5YVC4_9HYPO|nr:hypothetical protein CDD82_7149 [Ophiocordyceps australis]
MDRIKENLSVLLTKKGRKSPRCETANHVSKDVQGQEASARQENPAESQASIIGNLWVKAKEDLGDKERETLCKIINRLQKKPSQSPSSGENNTHDLLASINSVIATLETRDKTQCRRSNVENTILTTTLNIKQLGDAAAKFDQSGYVSLGWSIVTFGLQIALQAREAREFILQAASVITGIMTRYAAYERLYRAEFWRDEGHWRDFDRHLTSVYTALLRFIVQLDHYLQEASPSSCIIVYLSYTVLF